MIHKYYDINFTIISFLHVQKWKNKKQSKINVSRIDQS